MINKLSAAVASCRLLALLAIIGHNLSFGLGGTGMI